jgi:hypothetical protein
MLGTSFVLFSFVGATIEGDDIVFTHYALLITSIRHSLRTPSYFPKKKYLVCMCMTRFLGEGGPSVFLYFLSVFCYFF